MKVKSISSIVAAVACSLSTPVYAIPLSQDQVPSEIPRHASFPVRMNDVQPSGWRSLTPWGEGVGVSSDGFVEIRSIEMSCEINGQSQVVLSGLDNIGAARYQLDPWYEGDALAMIPPQRTPQGTLIFPVTAGTITHWWSSRRPTVTNAENCRVESEIKASPGVVFAIGGDFWVDETAGWAGDDVNNRYMGRSSWFSGGGDEFQKVNF